MSRDRALITIVAATCALLAGCGSSAHVTKSAQHGAPRWNPKSGPPRCDALPVGPYKTCVFGGKRFPIAQRGYKVQIPTLSARIDRVVAARLSPSPTFLGKRRVSATGTFLIVTLTITDRAFASDESRDFVEFHDASQVELVLGNKVFLPAQKAEEADSAAFMNGDSFSPRDTRTGDVIFDVPARLAQNILENGAVVLTDFAWYVDSPSTYGLLKLQ
jgi:hypothetical protein